MQEILSILFIILGVLIIVCFDMGQNLFGSKIIPQDCSIWFDGCNTCKKNENGIVLCTEKVCHIHEITEAKCLKYEK